MFFGYSWARWATLKSSAFDLAYFDQVVWNASQGHGFTSSFAPYPFFGQHFSPALALFVPMYWIHPSPLWLLGAQSAALGAAVVPLYLLARRWLDHRAALVVCVAYCAQLFVLRAVTYDFHTEALAVPFVFLAVLGAARGDSVGDRLLVLSGVAPMLCKEDGALVSLGIGFLAWTVFRRRSGMVLMVAALAVGLVVMSVVMPAIRGGRPGDLAGRYAYLGSTAPGIVIGAVTHPWVVVTHLLSPGPVFALLLMLAGVAFLPLARPLAALSAAPALMLELLSQHWQQQTLLDQYGLQPGPLLFVAALLGWVALRNRVKTAGPVVLLGAALVILIAAAPRPSLGSFEQGQAAMNLSRAVPLDASVAASSDLMPMLSEHASIGLLPAHESDWVAVDASTEGTDFVSGLPSRGYVLVGRWSALSLWHRQA